MDKEFSNDKATTEWLKAQKRGTMYAYKYSWKFFLEFAKLTGDKLIESRKADKDYTWERKTLEFKNWLIQKGLSDNSAVGATTAVRSFFAYYRVDLTFKRTERAKLTEAIRKTEDYRFSLEDLRKMYDFADLEEKYVLTVGKSFGLRASDFLKLKRGDLETYLDRPVPISIGEITTQKERTKAYPFIDSDAKPVIKLMLDYMNTKGRINPADKMLSFGDAIQLSRVLRRVTVKASINVGNKVVRFHCLRKFLIDRISRFMSESKWKQIVGKQISEGAYVSPESLREDYRRIMSETLLNKTTFCNGSDCENFEQISETKLLSFLRNGWQIVHRLSNGEVIVRR